MPLGLKLLGEHEVKSRMIGTEKFRFFLDPSRENPKVQIYYDKGRKSWDDVGSLDIQMEGEGIALSGCRLAPFLRMRNIGKIAYWYLKDEMLKRGFKGIIFKDVINPFLFEKFQGPGYGKAKHSPFTGSDDFEKKLEPSELKHKIEPFERQVASFLKLSSQFQGKNIPEPEIQRMAEDIVSKAEKKEFGHEEAAGLFLPDVLSPKGKMGRRKKNEIAETGSAILGYLKDGRMDLSKVRFIGRKGAV